MNSIGGLFGKLLGGHGSHGSNHGSGYGGYPQQSNMMYAQQGKPKRGKGMGMGGVALGAGAGILGGVLLADAIEDYGEHEYEHGL